MSNITPFGPIAALISSATWAIGSSAYSRIGRTTDPMTINFTRAALTAPIFLFVVFVMNAGGSPTEFTELYRNFPQEKYAWFFVSLLASYGMGDIFFIISTRHLGITTALAIASSYPLVNVFIEILLGRNLLLTQWLGLFLALGGVIWVILQSDEGERTAKSNGDVPAVFKKSFRMGLIFGILTTLCWAINVFSVSRGGEGIDAVLGNSVRMSYAFLFIGLTYSIKFRTFPRLVEAQELKRSWWIFLLESFGGSLLYVYGMSRSPVVLGSTLSSLAPVLAVPVSVLMGLEKFSLKKTFAILLVVVGIFFISYV